MYTLRPQIYEDHGQSSLRGVCIEIDLWKFRGEDASTPTDNVLIVKPNRFRLSFMQDFAAVIF